MPHWRERNSLHLVEGAVSGRNPRRVQEVTHIIKEDNYTSAGQEVCALEHMAAAYEGSRRMLEMAQGQQCQTFLLLSSGAVYGFIQKVMRHLQSRKATLMTIYESPMSISLQIF